MTALAQDNKALDAYLNKQSDFAVGLVKDPVVMERAVALQGNQEAMKKFMESYVKKLDTDLTIELGEMFDQFDKDGNGTLDAKEELGLMNVYLVKNCEIGKITIQKSITAAMGPALGKKINLTHVQFWCSKINIFLIHLLIQCNGEFIYIMIALTQPNHYSFLLSLSRARALSLPPFPHLSMFVTDSMYTTDMPITKAEFGEVVTVFLNDTTVPAMNKAFDEILKDQLARVGEISEAMFKDIDENHDGKLSKKEFVDHFGEAGRKFCEPSDEAKAMIHITVAKSIEDATPKLIKMIQDKIDSRNCQCSIM
jgi:Ca2+-binding EF-hand superfamily protein